MRPVGLAAARRLALFLGYLTPSGGDTRDCEPWTLSFFHGESEEVDTIDSTRKGSLSSRRTISP